LISTSDTSTAALWKGTSITPGGQLSFEETVGAVACYADGQLLVAGQRDLYRLERDSRREVLAQHRPC
jgi:hypothetical protein